MADIHEYKDPKPSKVPAIALGARVVTLVSLVASIIILKNNEFTFTFDSDKFRFSATDTSSYKYVLLIMVLGFAYTLCQIPFAIYYLKTGKTLINHYFFFLYDLFGDKFGLVLLATSVGAAFGVTVETKRSVDSLKAFKQFDGLDNYVSKMNDFCLMAYLSAGFLLLGFLSSAVSSIISSLAVARFSKH